MTDDRGARLLLTERDALVPILRATPAADLDRPTACAGWSVRDVLAHCAAALHRVATGDLHRFTPADNERDVALRRDRPADAVVDELATGYEAAATAFAAAPGRYDGVALGEWIHGGDVREALGRPDAYASAGLDDALELLVGWSRRESAPYTQVTLPDRRLVLGEPGTAEAATLDTDPGTLLRLCAGRPADPARYRLGGAGAGEYHLFA
ncbi:MAG TPA: maleylpyruvate isomerase family mycothiol-dependent enzyme [Actinocatenispora sp.]